MVDVKTSKVIERYLVIVDTEIADCKRIIELKIQIN